MKYLLRIRECHWLRGSSTKMIYEDELGKSFVGPPISFVHGEAVVVEASDAPSGDGNYHITKVLGPARGK